MKFTCTRALPLVATALFGFVGLAHAERPLNVDDASTLDKGGAELEFGWFKDDKTKGLEATAGFGLIDNVQAEVGFGRSRDSSATPTETTNGHGLALKWVPLQSESGLSAGLKYEYGRDRLDGVSTRVHVLNGLLTWSFKGGQLAHLNAGREIERERGASDGVNTWGLALDWPFTESLDFVAETFGAEHRGPDRAVGLRYEVSEGLKVSAAIGRGNNRNIANAGITWEF